MSPHHACYRHGHAARGLPNLQTRDSERAKRLANIAAHNGRYGRLFDLAPAEFPEESLWALANALTHAPEQPRDGADPLEGDIPAAYTYFGQFIDHDQTFDPSTFQQRKNDPEEIRDFRTPRLDLDQLYGRGPDDQPYLYNGRKLLQGDRFAAVGRNPRARDLPRAPVNDSGVRRAVIGDPRNDENVIVSQLHGMFTRFHNGLADAHPRAPFEELQNEVRWHYQWAIVHDYLPMIVDARVLERISPAILESKRGFFTYPVALALYGRSDAVFMPVEYSGAAFRFGHAMVRSGYRLNENIDPLPILNAENPRASLGAFGEFPKSWAIDWHRFIDIPGARRPTSPSDRVQMSYRIDTSLVDPLGNLPANVAGEGAVHDRRGVNLPFRSLVRGMSLGLPSGQTLARQIGEPVLLDEEILVGPAIAGRNEAEGAVRITEIDPAFTGKCPLFVYVLAEARRNFYRHGRAVLGGVGGRIVAEVMLGLLQQDRTSFLHAGHWTPSCAVGGKFGLAELLGAALSA